MTNYFCISDKTIFITGASSGIGRATAIECSRLGAKVIITGRNISALNETFTSLKGDGHVQITGDLTSKENMLNIVSSLTKLDGIVICAGTLSTVPTKMIQEEDIKRTFDLNYHSVVLMMSEILASKKLNKGASIVFISSVAATSSFEVGNAIYSSSKAAILAYSRVLAVELLKRRIRVNCVLPAMIKTPFLNNFEIDEMQLMENEERYPWGYGEPIDVANAAIYLLCDATKWMTGSSITLDGGLSLN